MKKGMSDFGLGLAVLACVIAFAGFRFGPGVVLQAVLVGATGAASIFLWNRGGAAGKVVAAVLLPAVLLLLFPTDRVRLAIRELAADQAKAAQVRK